MKITIYILISLISLFLSQNIITSWNYDKVAMYDLQKIITFLNNFANNPIDIQNTFEKDTISVKNIKLIKVETNLYDSLINYNTGLLLLTPNKITLNFNFSYTESSQGLSDTATLTLSILSFKLKIYNNKTSENVYFNIKMTSPIENYSVPGIKDKEFLKKLIELLYEGFNHNSILNNIIAPFMDSRLNEYYTEFYKNYQDFTLKTNSFFGNTQIQIKNDKFLYFCEDVVGEYKTALCYYSGEIQENINFRNNKISDKTLSPLKNERFIDNEGDAYIIFINNELVGNSIDYIAEKYFKTNAKIYNEKTNVKELSYDFTVGSLQKYFKGLEDLKKEDKFDCEVYIESGNVNEAVYRVKVNIKNSNVNSFEMRIKSALTLDIFILKTVRFNLCIKDTKTLDIKVLTEKIEISDLDGLKSAIEESFDFEKNPICLNNDGITLKNYFMEISKAYVQKEGIYFEGDQLYQ